MPSNPSPAQSQASKQNGNRSRGPTAPEGKTRSALSSRNSGLRAQTIALDHEPMQYADRCNQWHDFYQPQSPATLHFTNECARASLLSDRCAQYRQAELQKQVRAEERTWNRKQQRRLRYLTSKIKTSPGETVGELNEFGRGVGFLFDSFEALIDAVRNWGYLPPNLAEIALQLGGCTLEPESIRANLLAYTIQINNLGCTPGVPAAVIDSWLEPARRPAALGDRPRQEVMSSNPGECRERLLRALEDERDRLRDLEERVRREIDGPSLLEALDRASILTEETARRLARSQSEARTTFHRAWKDLVKVLAADREDLGPVSSVLCPSCSKNVAVAEAGSEGEEPEPAGADELLPARTNAVPPPACRQADGFFAGEPENAGGRVTQIQDETITSVEPRVPGEASAKPAQTGAQNPPQAAQTGAMAAGASLASSRLPGSTPCPPAPGNSQDCSPGAVPHRDAHPSPVPDGATAPLDPGEAIIEKYKKEFADLREYDHLE